MTKEVGSAKWLLEIGPLVTMTNTLPVSWKDTLACARMVEAIRYIWNRIIPTASPRSHALCPSDAKVATIDPLQSIHWRTKPGTVLITEGNVIDSNVTPIVSSIDTFKYHLKVGSAGYGDFCPLPDIALKQNRRLTLLVIDTETFFGVFAKSSIFTPWHPWNWPFTEKLEIAILSRVVRSR